MSKQIIKAIDIPVYLLNKQGVIVRLLNNPTEKSNMLPLNNLGKLNIRDLIIGQEEYEKHTLLLRKVLETGKSENLTVKIKVENDNELYVTIRMVYMNYKHVFVFARNVTENKLQQMQLLEAKNKAEEANLLKSTFLANMSHEIRTPLNAIVGFSSPLSEFVKEEEIKEYVHIIEENNELLLQLINDILDISRIEAGLLEFVEGELDVNEAIYEIKAISQLKTSPKVSFHIYQAMDTCIIHTIPKRVKQVINNYVSNAIKYTDEGTIDIGYDIVEQEKIRFFVRDTGSGIPADKQKHIFERFVKLNSFKQGTGLGLSICTMIAEKMHGEVGVKSKPGEGSEFWFEVPYTPAKKE